MKQALKTIFLLCLVHTVQAQELEQLLNTKPVYSLDPLTAMSFGDQSPWSYKDEWLEQALNLWSLSGPETKKYVEYLLEEYLPTDTQKGMALLSLNGRKADILMSSFPQVNWRQTKQSYLSYRDNVLQMREESSTTETMTLSLSFHQDNDLMRYRYLFYQDSLEDIVGYCHDVQMGYGDSVFVKEFGSYVVVSVQGDGNISLYMGDKKDLRSGDLGFVSCDGVWKEYFPAGVDWYGSKKKILLERIFFGTITDQEDWLKPIFEYWDPFRDIPENRISNGNLCGCWTPIDLPD